MAGLQFRFKNNFIITAFFCTMVLGLAGWGCGSKTGSKQQVFTYNQVEGLPTLDPAFAKNQATMWVAHQLFNTLV